MLSGAFGSGWDGNRVSPASVRGFSSILPHEVDYHEHPADFFISVPAVAMTAAATAALTATPTATPTDTAAVMEVVTVAMAAAAATVVEVPVVVVTACPPLAKA